MITILNYTRIVGFFFFFFGGGGIGILAILARST